jgi:serine/threonine-protein kinase
MIGTIVDQYKIIERIAAGGMGEVYRAVDLELERDVAIKCVRPELSDLEEATKRFRAEARTLARLSHSNIATIYRFFAEGDRLFLVMEFIDGKPFGEMIVGQGFIPHDQAVGLVQEALTGLGYAHKNNIVHRDIKPGNLMVDAEGTVKVLDFGIAHLVGGTRLTRVGSVVGTPAYMAPEQILGKDIDQRTDLYSIGVVLYEMLSGKLPYAANSDFELMRAHLEEVPRPMSELSKNEVPAPLQETVERALAKDTTERFQSADEFVQALDNATHDRTVARAPPIADSASAATVAATDIPVPPDAHERPPIRTWALGGVAALLLAIVAAVNLMQEQPVAPANQPAPDVSIRGGPIAADNQAELPNDASGAAPSPQASEQAPQLLATGTSAATSAPAAQTSSTAPSIATPIDKPIENPAQTAPVSSAPAQPRTVRSVPPPAPPRAVAKPQSRIVAVKVSVHERQGTGRLSRDAGYNGSFRLSVPTGAERNVNVVEVVKVYRDGELIREQTVAEEVRTPGTFKTKRRIDGLKTLEPGLYDVNLLFQQDGITLGRHAWKLTVKG